MECRAMAVRQKLGGAGGGGGSRGDGGLATAGPPGWFERVPAAVAAVELFSQAGTGPPMLKRARQAALGAFVAVAAAEKPVMTARMRSNLAVVR